MRFTLMHPRLSFGSKMTLLTLLTSGVTLLLAGAVLVCSDWLERRAAVEQTVATQADIIGMGVTAALTFDDAASASETLRVLEAEGQILEAGVYRQNGTLFARYRRTGATAMLPPRLDVATASVLSDSLTLYRYIRLDGDHIGAILVRYDLGKMNAHLRDQLMLIAVAGLAALVGGYLFSSRLQRLLTDPVSHLGEIARQVSATRDYALRARTFADDELGALTASFNEMLEQIQRRDADLKRAYEVLEERVIERTRDLEEAKKAAEIATLAKSEFLANMSHEIRTPMTAILGFADLMLDPNASPSDRLNHIQTVRRNGDHLLTIINDILDLSKIEAGRMTIEQIDSSPVQMVEEVFSLMNVRALGKGLALKTEYTYPLPRQIKSDSVRLRQILVNLVGNAIKFTDTGSVTISVRLDQLAAAPEDARAQQSSVKHCRNLVFEVTDTGIGLTPEQIGRLFRPFTQADTSTARRFGGTGLGLTISKHLAQMLGGDLLVTSSPGRRTTFSMTMNVGAFEDSQLLRSPAAVADHGTPPSAPGGEESLSGRVLLAEDGPDNQRLICFHLRKAGATVDVADNGRIAVEKALAAAQAGAPYDAILMDMQMPELDGYGATSRLRRQGYCGPIIALTAHAMAGDREKCLAAGCNDYAVKPIDKLALFATLRRLMVRPFVRPAA